MARPAGAKNKRSQDLDTLIDASKLPLVAAYLAVLNADWATLGYGSETVQRFTKDGDPYEEERITLDHRVSAMRELMKYRYAQKRSVEVSGPGGKPIETVSQLQLSDETRERLELLRKPK